MRLEYRVFALNPARVKAQRILIRGAREAGFDLVADNFEPSPFEDAPSCPRIGPIGGCGIDLSPNPQLSDRYVCDAIPSAENDFGGQNFTHWCNPQADLLMKAADRSVDPAIRLELMNEVYELQAEDAIGLPLYVVPAVTVWREDQIAGPIGAWNGSPYGTFFNMNEWYLAPP